MNTTATVQGWILGTGLALVLTMIPVSEAKAADTTCTACNPTANPVGQAPEVLTDQALDNKYRTDQSSGIVDVEVCEQGTSNCATFTGNGGTWERIL